MDSRALVCSSDFKLRQNRSIRPFCQGLPKSVSCWRTPIIFSTLRNTSVLNTTALVIKAFLLWCKKVYLRKKALSPKEILHK